MIRIGFYCQGVMELELNSEINKISIRQSYLSGDSLQPLLTNLFYYRNYCLGKDSDSFPFRFESIWEEEFSSKRIIFTCSSPSSKMNIKVQSTKSEKNEFEQDILFQDLFRELFLSLDNILNEYGLVGYNDLWEVGNFPIAEYLLLKAELSGHRLKPIRYSNVNEEWRSKYNLNSELNLLKLKIGHWGATPANLGMLEE